MHDEYFNHGISVAFPQFINHGQADRSSRDETPRYFNITQTNNPYVLRYEEVQIENISGNFKMYKHDLRMVEGLTFVDHHGNNAYDVLNNEALNAALTSYKEQLLEDKKRVIEDPQIKHDVRFIWYCKDQMSQMGLTLSKDNKIVLKRVQKPKDPKAHTVTKNEVNRYFKYSLENFMSYEIDISMRIGVTTKNLYNVITVFKRTLPDNISLSTISENINPYWGTNGIKEFCEELWNDPKLAKPKPKKATKKGKK